MIEMDTFKEEARDVLHRIDKVSKIPVYYIQVDDYYIRANGGDPSQVNENGVIFKKRDTKFYCLEDYYTGKPINVKLWGLKGDGKTNDTVAFGKANAECKQLGATLYIPVGTYLCDPQFSCSAIGERGAKFVVSGVSVSIVDNVRLENLEFVGNRKVLNLGTSVSFIGCKFMNLGIVSEGLGKHESIIFRDCEMSHTGTAVRMNDIHLIMEGNRCTGLDGMFIALYDVNLELKNNYINAGTPVKVGAGGENTGFVVFNVFNGQNDIVETIVQHSNVTLNEI